MKKLLILFLSALSLTAFAQQKKNIRILQPKSSNEMVSRSVNNEMTRLFTESSEWQPVTYPSVDEVNIDESKNKAQLAQYMLITEIEDMGGMYIISSKIVEIETAGVISTAMSMSESSPQSLIQACTELAKQLLNN